MTKDTKGTRDHPPSQATTKQRIRDTIRHHAEQHSYQPIETPVIESQSLLTSKFTGGEEILKEMYTLTDRGERDLGLRYDLTVPFARFVAERPELKHPFKRYQHGSVFRDGPVQQGRYREFEQFDLDVVGGSGPLWEAELITIVSTVLRDLGINPRIEVNTRSLLTSVIDHVGVAGADADAVILSLDKVKKIGRDGVTEELQEKGLRRSTIDELFTILDVDGSNDDLIDHFQQFGDLARLDELHALLTTNEVSYELNPFLARGLTYYTGVVFEAFTAGDDFDRSIASGGRYDDMIASLSDHEDKLPSVGASFGIDPLLDCLDQELSSRDEHVFILPLTDLTDVLPRADLLRSHGVPVMIGSPEKSFHKNMDYADKEGFGYLLVIGDDELETETYTVKDLETGEERSAELEAVPGLITGLKDI